MKAPQSFSSGMALRRHLLRSYGSFADKRNKNPEKSGTFIVDDRDDADIGADGKLYGNFCMIFAQADSDTELVVTLRGNIPRSPQVEAFLRNHGIAEMDSRQLGIDLRINRQNVSDLRELADVFDAIVAPGRRYNVASYKYVCPRTAETLRRLAGYLDGYAWQKSGFF